MQENGDEEIGSIDFLGYTLMIIILLFPGSSGLLLCVWPNCWPGEEGYDCAAGNVFLLLSHCDK